MIANAAAGNVSIQFGLCGPNTAVSTACASAANAIGDAMRAIQCDYADVMITGGSEAAITPMGLGGFISARALSHAQRRSRRRASRPFDKDRDGFVLSEGAGIVVLEELEHARKRGATIYAELLGVRQHGRRPPHHGAAPRRRRRRQGHAAWPCRTPSSTPRTCSTSTPTAPARSWATRPRRKAIKQVFGDHARQAGHQQHQEHDRPPARRQRRRRADRHAS